LVVLGWLLMERMITITLVTSRLGGFLATSPFPGQWAPAKVRIMLALALGIPIALALPEAGGDLAFDGHLALAAGLEVLLGVAVGFLFRLVVTAADFMAAMVSQVSWLSVPTSMSVDGGGQSQALGQLAGLLAMLVALGVGAHRVVLAHLLSSFQTLPPGSPMALGAAAQTMLPLMGRAWDVGLRLAVPVFAIALGVQAALALVARVAPSLQIFNVGFGVLVASGLVTFSASLRSVSEGLARFYGVLPDALDGMLTLVSGA
jgi:flagellar biosynthesis protein FliR